MRRVLLVRHALTDFDIASNAGRFCGRADPPLNEKGRSEAALLAERLPIASSQVIFASPLTRSRETAQIILGSSGVPLVVDERLREIDYAHWDGLSKAEIEKQFGAEYVKFNENPLLFHPGGRALLDTCAAAAWDWLSLLTADHVIAVTHKTWTRLLLCKILGLGYNRYRNAFDIKIAGVTCLVNIETGWRLDAVNYEATPKRIYGPLWSPTKM
jgi:broad specificity phosphatase PhoE